MSITASAISASIVLEDQRLHFLPKHVGTGLVMIEFEARVFSNLEELSADYKGGFWHFYELSNQGFYMAPNSDSPMSLLVDGNGFNGVMSADAAGIVSTLFTLSQMSFKYAGKAVGNRFSDGYHRLMSFADSHPESRQIFGAID